MSKVKIALNTLVAMVVWAVPIVGTAQQLLRGGSVDAVVAPIKLRDADAGLTATGWINGAGPFVFAIDTGAGVSIVSRRVVDQARLQVSKSRRPLVGGLSTAPIASDQEAQIGGLSLGKPDNRIPGRFVAAVADLPGSVDGVLDPTEIFSSYGFTVDLPHRELRVFNASARGLRLSEQPRDGAVVRWVREAGSHRPFVKLGDGRLALVDTGSGLGLALSDAPSSHSSSQRSDDARMRQDLGGGRVQSRRVAPQTVNIGALVLNGVPTDVLTGAAPGTPIILGRRALFPFSITFDPVANLIAFEPAERN